MNAVMMFQKNVWESHCIFYFHSITFCFKQPIKKIELIQNFHVLRALRFSCQDCIVWYQLVHVYCIYYILLPIALFASFSWQRLGMENEGLWGHRISTPCFYSFLLPFNNS